MEIVEKERTSNSSPASESRQNGVWEWFWQGHALRLAKASPRPSTLKRERLRRARLAAELASRAVDPIEPLREGSSLPLAISLYREAAYWGLLARDETKTAANIREAFETGGEAISKIGLSPEKLAEVRTVLVDKTFVESAEDNDRVLRREVDRCGVFVDALIETDADEADPVVAVILKRWLRVGIAFLVIAGLLLGIKIAVERAYRGPDLAKGRLWRASSQAFECAPERKECGGASTAIFFHTKEEKEPWVEIDLGVSQSFARLEVVNRQDCCAERAVPLVVEISDDRQSWREIARREQSFQTWQATFSPVKARYVRCRVDRTTRLHLVRVSVFAR